MPLVIVERGTYACGTKAMSTQIKDARKSNVCYSLLIVIQAHQFVGLLGVEISYCYFAIYDS